MISARLAVLAVLIAASVAGVLTYLVGQPIVTVAVNQRPSPFNPIVNGPDTTASISADPFQNGDEKAAIAYLRAAQEILRRAPSAQASARNDELPIKGRIPLPKKRPIIRP